MSGGAAPMRFQDQGPVREGAFYVERDADRELFEALLAGCFCYILAPRQIGKTSLRVRTEARLRARGARCASVDLTRIGTAGATPETWYFSLLAEIAPSLRPGLDPADFWRAHADLTPAYRFTRFLRDEVLLPSTCPMVISVDEIEMVLDLPFDRGDLFAMIRSVYTARADDPIWERLTFCLLGLASPGELMTNPEHTPFNVGRAIRIDDFTAAEAAALLPGLEGAGDDARALLDAIMAWTSGHPYMTQRLCRALTAEPTGERAPEAPAARVERLVREIFLEHGRVEDPNLYYAEMRLRGARAGPLGAEIFRVYRSLLYRGAIPARGNSAAQQELRLAGMVRERADHDGAHLILRNRVFAEVFDARWAEESALGNPLAEPVAQWLRWGRLDDFLLQGVALEIARDWSRDRDDVTADERSFLDACGRAEGERAAARQASRERRILAVLAAAVGLTLLAVVGLGRERLHSVEAKRQRAALTQKNAELVQRGKDLEASAERLRGDIVRVKEQSEAKFTAATERAIKAESEARQIEALAARIEQEARVKGKAAQREADLLKERADEAQTRAAQERATADDARRLAIEAAEALRRSEGEVLVAQRALDTERAGRGLAEKQLKEERDHRARVEQDLESAKERLERAQREILYLGKHTCWPNEDQLPAIP